MNKTFGYVVTKTENYFNPEPVDNIFSTVMGIFHDKQDAINFTNQLVEEEKTETRCAYTYSYSYSENFKSCTAWNKGNFNNRHSTC